MKVTHYLVEDFEMDRI